MIDIITAFVLGGFCGGFITTLILTAIIVWRD